MREVSWQSTVSSAWLTHRHNNLPPGYRMVHRKPDPDTDVCKVERLDHLGDLSPSHIAFAGDRAIDCDFRQGLHSRQPGEELLRDVGSYLCDSGLNNRLGLSVLQSPTDRWVEYLLADGQGTIAWRHADDSVHGVPTEWAFFPKGRRGGMEGDQSVQNTTRRSAVMLW